MTDSQKLIAEYVANGSETAFRELVNAVQAAPIGMAASVSTFALAAGIAPGSTVKQERFAIAPLPPQPIEQGMVGPGLLAQILANKYEYHQPLYRQEKMFRQQFGVDLSRKTMGCRVEQAAFVLATEPNRNDK